MKGYIDLHFYSRKKINQQFALMLRQTTSMHYTKNNNHFRFSPTFRKNNTKFPSFRKIRSIFY